MTQMIELNKAKAAIQNLRSQYSSKITQLEAELARLRQTNQTPAYKNDQNYQRQLARVIKAGQTGELDRLGRSAIKRYVGCGDDRAQAIQVELVRTGLAVQRGRTVVWSDGATQAA